MRKSFIRAVAGTFGLEELAAEFDDNEHSEDANGNSQQAIFDAQQMVLSNIMVVSALLLGFIVTGTLLSIGLTGRDNFGIKELITFFNWTSMAAVFAFISLITSFLTSVWGAHRMQIAGPAVAAKALTQGSVFRHILAEGSLYMSCFFFLVSLNQYIWMVYSGPDICPTYRGAASFCARQGADLYFASAAKCKPLCSQLDLQAGCNAETSMMDCLCLEACKYPWETLYNWSLSSTGKPRPGVEVFRYHFYGYRSPGILNKPAREKIITASSSLMCNHEVLENNKDQCFQDSSRDCNSIFLAWQKSEECMEGSIQDTMVCAKVCSWTQGQPPRAALRRTTDLFFYPLGLTLLVLTLGRVIVIIARACAVFRNGNAQLGRMLHSSPENVSDEESSG